MQYFFQSPAKTKQQEGEEYSDQHDAPFPGTACHSDAGRQPSARSRSKPMDLFAFVGADNYPGTQKPNASQDALDDAACSTHIVAIGNGQNGHRRTKSYEPEGPDTRRLTVEVAVEPYCCTCQHGGT